MFVKKVKSCLTRQLAPNQIMLPSFVAWAVATKRSFLRQLHHHLCFVSCSSGWKHSDFSGDLKKDVSENTVSYSSELFGGH